MKYFNKSIIIFNLTDGCKYYFIQLLKSICGRERDGGNY